MKRFIFCDLHGTLVTRTLNELSIPHLCHILKVSPDTLDEAYRAFEPAWDLGECDFKAFWGKVIERVGAPISDGLIEECQRTILESCFVLPGASDLMDELDGQGDVVIVSNTKREVLEWLEIRYPRMFRDVTFAPSYLLGARKPDLDYFMRLAILVGNIGGDDPIEKTLARVREGMWIDDNNVCVLAASFLGIRNGIEAISPRATLKALVADKKIEPS